MRQTGDPIEYWKAGAQLSGYVTGYHRFTAVLPPETTLHDAFFPSWVTIRVTVGEARPWSLTLGNRTFSPMPAAAFTGPTSHAGYLSSHGGTIVGVGILPAGWARLFGGDVSRYANRVVPLQQLDGAADLLAADLADAPDPVAVFERWLGARLQHRPPEDPRIAQLFAMLDDPHMTRVEAIAERLAMAPRALAALTRFNFGFTPKLLVRRTRFLRALSAVLTHPADATGLLEAAGYWDRSHFLRDSNLFLGCSIREFNKRRGVLNQVAMRVRQEVMGSPV